MDPNHKCLALRDSHESECNIIMCYQFIWLRIQGSHGESHPTLAGGLGGTPSARPTMDLIFLDFIEYFGQFGKIQDSPPPPTPEGRHTPRGNPGSATVYLVADPGEARSRNSGPRKRWGPQSVAQISCFVWTDFLDPPPILQCVIILNTISKRQDGSDLFRILHTKSFSKFTEASVYYVIAVCWSHGTTSPFLA